MSASLPLASLGFLRAAVAAPGLRVGDVAHNLAETLRTLRAAADQGASLVIFPELGLTGYSCADLFFQRPLLRTAAEALGAVAAATGSPGIAAIVGLPWELDGRLYNVAAVCAGGRVLGLVPKTHLPNHAEFYERRWFASARVLAASEVSCAGRSVPIGTDLVFAAEDLPGCVLGVEICEDLWSVEPPSGRLALSGATVLANLSASDETLGKAAYRRSLVAQQSARCLAAYLYAAAGPGESTTDVVFSGHGILAENGQVLAEAERFRFDSQLTLADIDLEQLAHDRMQSTTFGGTPAAPSRRVSFRLDPRPAPAPLRRQVDPRPFVPSDPGRRSAHCEEIFAIQSTALARRLLHTGTRTVVVGISGGLDSTLALLVAARAFDAIGLPRAGLHAVTMPGFGTTGRTRSNAENLAQGLGATLRTISIDAAVLQHFRDIGHDPAQHDITYENAQARERTQILMDLANQLGGLTLGTGDLSEAALGWCTFNGDHMSMYHVNAGVPKTLVRHLVEWCAEHVFTGPISATLRDIAATPISPELLPPTADGAPSQETEKAVGPYELHDFFLSQMLRHGHGPQRILFLAELAFGGAYSQEELRRWLGVFLRRFFSQQFKRSSMPDGPKVGSVALSPRGDWRMPSDASAAAWLAELENS